MPTRKIYFYRIHAGQDRSRAMRTWDHVPPLKNLASLPFQSEGGCYVEAGDDDVFLAIVSKNTATEAQVVFGRTRRSALPPEERRGKLSPISLREGGGLCEMTYMLMLKEPRLVVADFNFHGPRVTRFPWYLRQVLGRQAVRVRFEQLILGDALERLQAIGELSSLEFAFRSSYADILADQRGTVGEVGQYLRQLSKTGGVETLRLKLSRGRKRDDPYLSSFWTKFSRAIGRRPDRFEHANKFVVAGHSVDTGRVAEVDLLGDMLVVQRDIPHVEGTRGLDAGKAFNGLRGAYREVKDVIDDLPTVAIRRANPRRG